MQFYHNKHRHVQSLINLRSKANYSLHILGNSVRELFDAAAIKLLHAMMEHFTDIEVQLSCCKIIAQLSMGKKNI